MQVQNQAKASPSQADPTEEPIRLLIVFDGVSWFIRNVYIIEHELKLDRQIYHCDNPLGGPFVTLDEAVIAAKEIINGHQPTV